MMEKPGRPRTGQIIKIIVCTLLAGIWLFPIFVSVASAFKTPSDFITSSFYKLPLANGFAENFETAVKTYGLMRHFGNSLFYAVAGTLLCIAVSAMAAYGISIVRPRFSFLIFILIYSGTIFPFQMYLLPLYKTFIATNLYDTRLGMVLFYGTICTPFATFIYRSHYMTITNEIYESAMIDGCNAYTAFPHIFIPLLKVPTAVVIVFQAMWIWNDLLFGMVLAQSPDVRPVMVSVAQIAGAGGFNLPVLMVGVIITSIPTLLLFAFLQKYFVRGTSVGIVKG